MLALKPPLPPSLEQRLDKLLYSGPLSRSDPRKQEWESEDRKLEKERNPLF